MKIPTKNGLIKIGSVQIEGIGKMRSMSYQSSDETTEIYVYSRNYLKCAYLFVKHAIRTYMHYREDIEAVSFPEVNTTYGKGHPKYRPLPTHTDESSGIVTSCYKLTFVGRLRLLIGGKIYWQQIIGGQPLQPQKPSLSNPISSVVVNGDTITDKQHKSP